MVRADDGRRRKPASSRPPSMIRRSCSRRRRGSSRRARVGRRGPAAADPAGYRPDLVEGAIERLVELGMLDDEAFARAGWSRGTGRGRAASGRSARSCASRAWTCVGRARPRGTAGGRGRDPMPGTDREPARPTGPPPTAARRHARALERVADPGGAGSAPTRCWPGTGSTRRLPGGRGPHRCGGAGRT